MKKVISMFLISSLLISSLSLFGCNSNTDIIDDSDSDVISPDEKETNNDTKEENMEPKNPPVLYQISPDTSTLMMSYIIKTTNNKLIVIDGGGVATLVNNSGYLYTMLQNLTNSAKPEVEAWFLTHLHDDHLTEFNKIYKKAGIKVDTKNVYFNLPSRSFMEKVESGNSLYIYDETRDSYDKLFGEGAFDAAGGKTVKQGDKFNIDGVEVEILLTCLDEETETNINDTSLIFRLTIEGQTVLFLGDAGVKEGNRLLAEYGPEYLKSDIVQMAHHGQGGVSEEVYKAINPTMCLWPTPEWVYDNRNGNLKTLEVRQWMVDLGVKYHCVSGLEKSQQFTLPINFSKLTPTDITPPTVIVE